jgi:hypothetical protein
LVLYGKEGLIADMLKKKKKYRNDLKLYIKKDTKIRCCVYKTMHYAKIRRDGTILYNKKVYNSPSSAARAITGTEANGWRYWKYERTSGEWVGISELREG